jgi:hypothetical protein
MLSLSSACAGGEVCVGAYLRKVPPTQQKDESFEEGEDATSGRCQILGHGESFRV